METLRKKDIVPAAASSSGAFARPVRPVRRGGPRSGVARSSKRLAPCLGNRAWTPRLLMQLPKAPVSPKEPYTVISAAKPASAMHSGSDKIGRGAGGERGCQKV